MTADEAVTKLKAKGGNVSPVMFYCSRKHIPVLILCRVLSFTDIIIEKAKNTPKKHLECAEIPVTGARDSKHFQEEARSLESTGP